MRSTLPIKRVASVTLGKMVQPSAKEATDVLAPPYLRAAHVQPQGRMINLPEQPMWFSPTELRNLNLLRGDVVVVEGGAGYGRSAVIREDFSGWGFQNSIIRLRPHDWSCRRSVFGLCTAGGIEEWWRRLVTSTATLPHFTADKVSKFEVPMPAVGEQRAIADYLDRETAQIDALVATQEKFIGLLRERRLSAITQAFALLGAT